MELLVSTRLLNQFLKKSGAKVDPKEIESVIDAQKKEMAANNTSLETVLARAACPTTR